MIRNGELRKRGSEVKKLKSNFITSFIELLIYVNINTNTYGINLTEVKFYIKIQLFKISFGIFKFPLPIPKEISGLLFP